MANNSGADAFLVNSYILGNMFGPNPFSSYHGPFPMPHYQGAAIDARGNPIAGPQGSDYLTLLANPGKVTTPGALPPGPGGSAAPVYQSAPTATQTYSLPPNAPPTPAPAPAPAAPPGTTLNTAPMLGGGAAAQDAALQALIASVKAGKGADPMNTWLLARSGLVTGGGLGGPGNVGNSGAQGY